eukprot:3941504-Rhodomonas_salina.4
MSGTDTGAVASYARPMQYPVLTSRMLLPVSYRHGPAMRGCVGVQGELVRPGTSLPESTPKEQKPQTKFALLYQGCGVLRLILPFPAFARALYTCYPLLPPTKKNLVARRLFFLLLCLSFFFFFPFFLCFCQGHLFRDAVDTHTACATLSLVCSLSHTHAHTHTRHIATCAQHIYVEFVIEGFGALGFRLRLSALSFGLWALDFGLQAFDLGF